MPVPLRTLSAPEPPLTLSLPESPKSWSLPALPLMVSPLPLPAILSPFWVPLRVSGPFVPVMTAARAKPALTTTITASEVSRRIALRPILSFASPFALDILTNISTRKIAHFFPHLLCIRNPYRHSKHVCSPEQPYPERSSMQTSRIQLPGTGVKITWCENNLGQVVFMASGWPGKGHGTLG